MAGSVAHHHWGSRSDPILNVSEISGNVLLEFFFDVLDALVPSLVAAVPIEQNSPPAGILATSIRVAISDELSEQSRTVCDKCGSLTRRMLTSCIAAWSKMYFAASTSIGTVCSSQPAACNLTLGAPTVDYSRMNLHTMKHGPQEDGSMRAGSIEILGSNTEATDLFSMVSHLSRTPTTDSEQVAGGTDRGFQLEEVDLVIMNPPFTRNQSRGRKFSTEITRRMQAHELDIRDAIAADDLEAAEQISANGVRTFFTPIADKVLNRLRGTLAKILPATACIGADGLKERKFLAKRFYIERVITSHDPKRINFSENISIHECLLICRRNDQSEHAPTEFFSLKVMPDDAKQAMECADAIARGEEGWGSRLLWPSERMRAGDWSPVQWYDGTLAKVAKDLEEHAGLEPAAKRFVIGPDGRRIQDAFEVCGPETADSVPGFHSVSSTVRQTVRAEADVWYRPREGKERLAARYRARQGNLLVSMRLNTVSGRLSGLWTAKPSFGWWVLVAVPDEDSGKSLAV